MPKGPRSLEQYEREIADIVERFIEHGREFAALENEAEWAEFVSEKVLGYHYIEPSDAQLGFFEDARLRVLQALEDSPSYSMEVRDTEHGKTASFRGEKGRFVSFKDVIGFIAGRFNPFGR